MNKYLKLTKEGFTLVELMIVVAIIGILATIAVPQYKKFVSKSKQTEAKIALGGMYTAETSFQTENNSYSGCLGNIGYNRDGAKFYYTVGFKTAPATTGCAPDALNSCLVYQWVPNPGLTTFANSGTAICTDIVNSTFFAASIGDGATAASDRTKISATTAVDNKSFVLGAAAMLNGGANPLVYDSWSIDQTKNLQNDLSGL